MATALDYLVIRTGETQDDTTYYTDGMRYQHPTFAILHGRLDLKLTGDFLVGAVFGEKLVELQWMSQKVNGKNQIAAVAEQLGLAG